MRLTICAIGRLRKNDPRALLINDYVERIKKSGPAIGFKEISLQELDPARGQTGKNAQTRESQAILEAIPDGAHTILLDERGQNFTSEGLANHLADCRDRGIGMTVFALGGADGHTEQLRERADKIIALGKMTWPHMLARAMISEQLYRAITILSGHPYHRE